MKLLPILEHLLLEHKVTLDDGVEDFSEEKLTLIKKFINFVCSNLEIKEECDVILVNDREKFGLTTAGYNPSNNKTYIWVLGRHILDICRSSAHELKHQEQRELGELTPEAGEDGDKFEDQANSFAGVMMRKFSRENPEIYDLLSQI